MLLNKILKMFSQQLQEPSRQATPDLMVRVEHRMMELRSAREHVRAF